MANNTFTKSYADGDALLEADLDSGYQSLQPAIENLAYATTGSTSGYILASTGSNAVPGFISPNAFAATVGASGANAILGAVSSVNATVANLIALSIGASGANYIASVITSSGSNQILGAVSSVNATVANFIDRSRTRAASSVATYGGLAIAASDSGTFSNTASGQVSITNASCTITTSGRPVMITFITTNTTDGDDPGFSAENGAANIVFQRDGTDITQLVFGGTSVTAGFYPPGAFSFIDVVTAGTYVYTALVEADGASTVRARYVKLVAYEL